MCKILSKYFCCRGASEDDDTNNRNRARGPQSPRSRSRDPLINKGSKKTLQWSSTEDSKNSVGNSQLAFKRRVDKSVSERFEVYKGSMSQWLLLHPDLRDSQIKEAHESYKKGACTTFVSQFQEYFNGNNSNSSNGSNFQVLLKGYMKLESEISEELAGYLEVTSMNIGIYLDESTIMIGTCTDPRRPELILEIKPEISFLQNKIQIGSDSEFTAGNHFKLLDLIKANPSSGGESLYFTGTQRSNNIPKKLTVSPEEILAIFFEQLLLDVRSKLGVDVIHNIVITSPALLSSFEKGRIQQAMKMAGYPDVRIASSLLTTAIIYAADVGFHLSSPSSNHNSNKTEPKTILVVQAMEDSFSMGMIQVGKDIITKSSIGTENLAEGQEKSFMHAHSRLYEEDCILTPDQSKSVSSVYLKGLKQLTSEEKRKNFDAVILIKSSKAPQGIDSILKKIFGSTLRSRLVTEGPLAGACLLASKDESTSLLLPSHVNVRDASRGNLSLTSGLKDWSVHFKNRELKSGSAFELPILVKENTESAFTLMEEYLKDRVYSVVGKYKVSIQKQKEPMDRQVILRFWMDLNGVLTADGGFSGETDGYVRVENLMKSPTGASVPGSRILEYYKSITEEVKPPVTSPDLEETFLVEHHNSNNNSIENTLLLLDEQDDDSESTDSWTPYVPAAAPPAPERFPRTPSPLESIEEEKLDDSLTEADRRTLQWTPTPSPERELVKVTIKPLPVATPLKFSFESYEPYPYSPGILPSYSTLPSPQTPEALTLPNDDVFESAETNNQNASPATDPTPAHVPKPSPRSIPNSPGIIIIPPEIPQFSFIKPAIIKTVQEQLQEATEEGIKSHTAAMRSLTDNKKPYTETQVSKFHNDNFKAAQKAFTDTYNSSLTFHPELKSQVEQAQVTLSKEINLELNTYLQRYEIAIGRVLSILKTHTLEGECSYDEGMETFTNENPARTREAVHGEHDRLVSQTLNEFRAKVEKAGIEWDPILQTELQVKLAERLGDALEDLPDLKETSL